MNERVYNRLHASERLRTAVDVGMIQNVRNPRSWEGGKRSAPPQRLGSQQLRNNHVLSQVVLA